MRIETERLIITEFEPAMAQAVHENSLDEDTRRFVPDEVFETVEDAAETIAFLITRYGGADGPFTYPVITRSDGTNIGYVQLVPLENGAWEIGYHIAKKYTGCGYATEAVKAFLPFAADAVGTDEVHGVCLSANTASRRVLEKCGFDSVFEGSGDYQGQLRKIFRSVWKRPDRKPVQSACFRQSPINDQKKEDNPMIIHTDKAPAAVGPYSQAVRIGSLLFTSGQLGLVPETGALPEGIEAQTIQSLKNIEAILSAAGYGKTDVIKTTVYIKNMNDFATVNKLYAEFFGDHKPARSCVEVARLPKDGLVEIEIIAGNGD